jgi:hypothetical protein
MSIIIHVRYISISVRLRFNQYASHELESFEKYFYRLKDTASKVNFTCQNRTFSTDRTIGTSPLLHNGIFFGNHCNIYLCQVTANNRKSLWFLVERMKTEQLNMNMAGITLWYCLLFYVSYILCLFLNKLTIFSSAKYREGKIHFSLYRSNIL